MASSVGFGLVFDGKYSVGLYEETFSLIKSFYLTNVHRCVMFIDRWPVKESLICQDVACLAISHLYLWTASFHLHQSLVVVRAKKLPLSRPLPFVFIQNTKNAPYEAILVEVSRLCFQLAIHFLLFIQF